MAILNLTLANVILIWIISDRSSGLSSENVCLNTENCVEDDKTRYLFYDVNPPEGFNLRRDVYMRYAVLAHKMSKSKNPALNRFKLVLPPWSHLFHWKYTDKPEHIPWGLYFDLDSLRLFAPVIEMYEFFSSYPNKYTKVKIDQVYTLQHFKDMFETGNFEDRMMIEECTRKEHYSFFYYDNITSHHFACLSYHGPATKLQELFLKIPAKSILINHAEVALHGYFGSQLYWRARRSMRFSQQLKDVAAEFRKNHLQSSDSDDKTTLPEKWTEEKPGRIAIGGPYVAIHLRRRDFVRSRPAESPSLSSVAKQVENILNRLQLDTVFVATDGSTEEVKKLSELLSKYNLKRYEAPEGIRNKFGDGGIAIIDQIICSHARYFIGTHESTFSFRIQEEREILGFSVDTTFNVLCKDEGDCQKPSVWKIVY